MPEKNENHHNHHNDIKEEDKETIPETPEQVVLGFLGGKMQDLAMEKSDFNDPIYGEKLIRAYQDLAADGDFYGVPEVEGYSKKKPKALYNYLKDQQFSKSITNNQKPFSEHDSIMLNLLNNAIELLDKQKEQQA